VGVAVAGDAPPAAQAAAARTAHATVRRLFPAARPLRSPFAAMRAYQLPPTDGVSTADVFETLHAALDAAGAAATGIGEWSVSHADMDSVFGAVVAAARAAERRQRRRQRRRRAEEDGGNEEDTVESDAAGTHV
jgi:hypothetical protein